MKPGLLICFFFLFSFAQAQVCDDLIVSGCETSVESGWTKLSNCGSGSINIQYCHPKFYIGSGHNLTVKGTSAGKIVFDELLEKTTLSSGLKVRKAVGKNDDGKFYTGIFTYNEDDDIEGCYFKPGADRSEKIVIPN